MIIVSKNPVHSIFYLVLSFVNSVALLFMLGVEFISMLFLVIYVGAITVLFLFVIMMLNVKIIEMNERLLLYLPIAIVIMFAFVFEVILIINEVLLIEYKNVLSSENFYDNYSIFLSSFYNYFELFLTINIENLANILYSKFVYLFILGGMILLVAMIGTIILTLNHKFRTKRQDYYIQTNRLLQKSIRHVN